MMSPEVKHGKVCPYCGNATEFVDSVEIYGRSYGMVYLCRPCDAWVGVHKGTSSALGRLADAELREWKVKAHGYFDALWKRRMAADSCSKTKARATSYKWLSEQMGLAPQETHIGMFDVDQCKQVIELCRKHHRENSTA